MKQQHIDYQVVPNPKMRRWMAAAYRSVQHKPMIHGLIEVDVTRARAFLRDHKAKTGESLSFTAFLIACLAKAVDENKAVQAYRKGSKHLILFEDVDVYTPIERNVAGQKQIIPYIIRAANRKTVREIHQEIRAAQVEDVEKAWDGLQSHHLPWLLFLPVFLVLFLDEGEGIHRCGRSTWGRWASQQWVCLGKVQDGASLSPPNTMMTVGGIGEKPVVMDGQIVIRDYLSLTISFDHDIIDGAPAARFTQRLKELIESGYGLFDSTIEPGQASLSQSCVKG